MGVTPVIVTRGAFQQPVFVSDVIITPFLIVCDVTIAFYVVTSAFARRFGVFDDVEQLFERMFIVMVPFVFVVVVEGSYFVIIAPSDVSISFEKICDVTVLLKGIPVVPITFSRTPAAFTLATFVFMRLCDVIIFIMVPPVVTIVFDVIIATFS